MKKSIFFLAAMGCLLGATLVRADTNDSSRQLRDRAVAWVADHTGKGPDTDLIRTTTKCIDDSIDQGEVLSLRFGSRLTTSGQAEEMWLFAGQLFSVKYSDEQARQLDQGESSLDTYHAPRHEKMAETPSAQLSNLRFDNAKSIAGSQKVTGSVMCKVLNATSQQIAVRMWFHHGNTSVAGYFYLPHGLQDGELKFSFDPINPDHGAAIIDQPPSSDVVSGPLVVFVDVCESETQDGQPAVLHSNTLGALLNVSQ